MNKCVAILSLFLIMSCRKTDDRKYYSDSLVGKWLINSVDYTYDGKDILNEDVYIICSFNKNGSYDYYYPDYDETIQKGTYKVLRDTLTLCYESSKADHDLKYIITKMNFNNMIIERKVLMDSKNCTETQTWHKLK